MPTRYDMAPIGKLVEDNSTGFLHVTDVPIARVGVFPYRRADGSVEMEAKLPQDLLSDSTVESAANKAITNDHPNELVTRDNFSQFGKGVTASNPHTDGNNVRVDMTITDSDLINAIKDGKQELSIGFVTEVVPQSGDYQGIHYDSMQKNIQINHVAVVERGRAGHTVRLTGDSAMEVDHTQGGKKHMELTTVLLDGQNVRVDADDATKVSEANSNNGSLKEQLAAAKAKVAELEKKLGESDTTATDNQKKADTAQAKADTLETENKDLKAKLEKADSIDDAVEARLALIKQATPLVGDRFDFAGKSEQEVKVAALKARNDSFDATDKSEDYINAAYDFALDALDDQDESGVVGITKTHTGDKADSLKSLQNARYHMNESK